MSVSIIPPTLDDAAAFLAGVNRSRELHAGWVEPPATLEQFTAFVQRANGDRTASFFIRESASAEIVGVANLSEIVRGAFQSAYLGFYALAPLAGRGLMRPGLELVLAHAFGPLGLHRVEANVQPENARSLALIRRLGFRREGYSPRYLRIAGAWRDHERWAMTAEEKLDV
jgi:ribosomal-protein-alanine N-acetyltransferase